MDFHQILHVARQTRSRYDFRGVQIPILAVSHLQLPRFYMDNHNNPNSVKISVGSVLLLCNSVSVGRC